MKDFKNIQIATDILAIKISKQLFDTETLQTLLKEKELVALGDSETIQKVINVYGKEIKEESKDERD